MDDPLQKLFANAAGGFAPLREGFGLGGILARTACGNFPADYAAKAPQDADRAVSDAYWMREALWQAMGAHGRTRPNPAVGCVITQNNVLVARGATEVWGGRHAERVAMDAVRDPNHLVGATLYTTLEPCAHFGRQPPCCDLIANSSVQRCVVGAVDPYPQVSTRGIQRLRAAGKEVDCGILGAEVSAWHLAFTFKHLASRPLVGALVTSELRTDAWQTSPPCCALAYRDWLVKKYDLVITHGDAVAAGPNLTCRPGPDPTCDPAHAIVDPHNGLIGASAHVWQQFETLLRENKANVTLWLSPRVWQDSGLAARAARCAAIAGVKVNALGARYATWASAVSEVCAATATLVPPTAQNIHGVLLIGPAAHPLPLPQVDVVHMFGNRTSLPDTAYKHVAAFVRDDILVNEFCRPAQ